MTFSLVVAMFTFIILGAFLFLIILDIVFNYNTEERKLCRKKNIEYYNVTRITFVAFVWVISGVYIWG